jgi:hypothetical protein
LCGWGDLEAESSSAAPEGINAALTLLFFIVLLPLVDEGLATPEHEVHHAGEFVGDGGIGTRLVHACAQPAPDTASSRNIPRAASGARAASRRPATATCRPDIMGTFSVKGWLRALGWLATVVMLVISVGVLVTSL